ncbi:TPA: phage tail tape measure protein [Cronobacter sakazakii]|nr:phage tail tape measure protein [Cronobacter sakazakii]
MAIELVQANPDAIARMDEAGLQNLDQVVTDVAAGMRRLSLAVAPVIADVLSFTTQTARGLDELWRASQRSGASAEGISELGYAFKQAGVDDEKVQASLVNVNKRMQNASGAGGVFGSLDINTRDAQGNLRDTAEVFEALIKKLAALPLDKAQQFSKALGIDDDTLNAMRHGFSGYLQDYRKAASQAGFDASGSALSGHRYITAVNGLTTVQNIVTQKVGGELAAGLAGPLEKLLGKVTDNLPQIMAVTDKVVDGIVIAMDKLITIVSSVIDAVGGIVTLWGQIDTQSQIVISVLSGLLAAWRVLNAGFLVTPIGMILGLVSALALLWDDYQKWKSGADSLIDWSVWAPGIQDVLKAIGSLKTDFQFLTDKTVALGVALGEAFSAFMRLLNIDTSNFSAKWVFEQIIEGVRSSIRVLGSLLDALTKVTQGDFSGAWDSLQAAVAFAQHPVMQLQQKAVYALMDKGLQASRFLFSELTPDEAPFGVWGLEQKQQAIASPLLMDWSALSSGNASGAVTREAANLNQTTHINVYGTGDAARLGEEVARQMNDVNGRLVQTLTTGVR